jgi:ABC-type antimicrobial peptide transport system permease subunit
MGGLDRLRSAGGAPQLTGALVRVGGAGDSTVQRLVDLGWEPTTPPSKVGNLSQIGSVPRLLAGALAALGLAGIIHALLIAVTRGRGDIAVARALGFTPRQARATIIWQGLATTAAAIVIGVPVGVVIGRVVWKQVADGVGAIDLVSIPWLAFAIIPTAALIAVTATAAIVGSLAARLHPAAVLRSE